jgi:DeoR family transcriptional regulator, copper-sensing transcriptional repressor
MSKQKPPIERRNWILLRLRQQGSLSLEEILAELKVSPMTVNRDIQSMASEGVVKRTHGGIVLPDVTQQGTSCATCHAPISNRTQFLLTTASGANLAFCCPHCGFSQLGRFPNAVGVFATDFFYGTMIDAAITSFVIGSSVSLCCEPSVLSFKNRDQAEAFCRGFGGSIFNITQATTKI